MLQNRTFPNNLGDEAMDWVVVVDDDTVNLKMAGTILSKHNMRVTALKSGMALIDYVRTHQPDLILLDIKMYGRLFHNADAEVAWDGGIRHTGHFPDRG